MQSRKNGNFLPWEEFWQHSWLVKISGNLMKTRMLGIPLRLLLHLWGLDRSGTGPNPSLPWKEFWQHLCWGVNFQESHEDTDASISIEANFAPPIPPLGKILRVFFIADRFYHFLFYVKLLLHGGFFLQTLQESDGDYFTGECIKDPFNPRDWMKVK